MKWYEYVILMLVTIVVGLFVVMWIYDATTYAEYKKAPVHKNPVIMEFDDGLQITIYDSGRKEYWDWIRNEPYQVNK